jgi:hypothetical protein
MRGSFPQLNRGTSQASEVSGCLWAQPALHASFIALLIGTTWSTVTDAAQVKLESAEKHFFQVGKHISQSPVTTSEQALLKAKATYRELFIYDACGDKEEGRRERALFEEDVARCDPGSPTSVQALIYMSAVENQHYGDHDESLCANDQSVAAMVTMALAVSQTLRDHLLEQRTACGEPSMAGATSKQIPMVSDVDYWLALMNLRTR